MRKTITSIMSCLMAICMTATMVPVYGSVDRAITTNKTTATEKESEYVEGQAIIMYKGANTSSDATTFAAADNKDLGKNIEIIESYSFGDEAKTYSKSTNNDNGAFTVSLVKSDKYSTDELIEKLKKRSDIKYAEPNYKISIADYNDEYYKYQWSQDNQGQNGGIQGLDVNSDTELLTNNDSEEKIIALVDTGMDYNHEDLQGLAWENPYSSRKLAGKHGYDFMNYDDDPLDDNGHGTHCAGIMAANANNEKGIVGTAQSDNIKIMALKIFDENGTGTGMEAVGAYNYIYKAQQLGTNIVAVNNSWGGTGDDEESKILKNLIDLVGENGAISVCAAGNDGADNDTYSDIPSGIDSDYIISVAASNEKDELATFSNYGKESVDIAAPGTDILSTVSYDCFNPGIYADTDALCSTFYDYNSGEVVQTIDSKGYNGVVCGANQYPYGVDSDKSTVTLSDSEFFGEKNDNKGLVWNIKNAKKDKVYYLYLPYEVGESDTSIYTSCMLKVNGPAGGEDESDWLPNSYIGVLDAELDENGEVGSIEDADYIGDISENKNYWSHYQSQAMKSVSETTNRALVFVVYAAADGDYTVSIDDFGVSKENIKSEEFGKYDYYNGTSMATPCVTGALVATCNAYPEEDALQIKARILGSVRKTSELSEKVKSGGVLDLSKIGTPYMSVSNISMNSSKEIEIKGYYTSDAEVYINGDKVNIVSNDDNTIIVDGKDYVNKTVNIKIVKEGQEIEQECFMSSGKAFTKGENVNLDIDGGQLLSDGGNMYYFDNSGNGYLENCYEDEDTGEKETYWTSGIGGYDNTLFGKDYETVAIYYVYPESDYVMINHVVYGLLSIDVGYAKDTILAKYDFSTGWKKVSDIPENIEYTEKETLSAYNGDLYVIGGIDENNELSTKITKYQISSKKWSDAGNIPEGRYGAKSVQVGNKLVLTLGGSADNNVPSNLIYDGKTWSKSKATLGYSHDIVAETYDDSTFYYSDAQIGLIKDGIIYTNFKAEGIGDTFIYNVSKDSYQSAGYSLNTDSLNKDYLLATVKEDKFIVLYGEVSTYYDDYDDYYQYSTISYYYDEEEEDDNPVYSLSIPITSGCVNVVDKTEYVGYVNGAGYYLPGDTINLVPIVYEGMTIDKFLVNGKSIAKGKLGYSYTAKAYTLSGTVTTELKASFKTSTGKKLKAGKISKITRTKNNKKIKVKLTKLANATGYQVQCSTSKKFTKKTTKNISRKKQTMIFKGLKAKKVYYVRARAYLKVKGKKTYGAWSGVKTVKVNKKK